MKAANDENGVVGQRRVRALNKIYFQAQVANEITKP